VEELQAEGITMSAGHEDRDTNGSFDMSGRDQVTLSAQERQKLARLEERVRLHDPDFASRMRGRSRRWVREAVTLLHLSDMPAWLGVVLLIAGLATTVLVVGSFVWLSVLTIGLTVVGAHRVGQSVSAKLGRTTVDRDADLTQ
jgi:hypothetical protein